MVSFGFLPHFSGSILKWRIWLWRRKVHRCRKCLDGLIHRWSRTLWTVYGLLLSIWSIPDDLSLLQIGKTHGEWLHTLEYHLSTSDSFNLYSFWVLICSRIYEKAVLCGLSHPQFIRTHAIRHIGAALCDLRLFPVTVS